MSSSYFYTSTGVLKLCNILFGALSLVLIADSFIRDFVPVHEEILFVCVVSTVLALSSIYLVIYYFKYESLKTSTINGRIDFAYHIVAGIGLVLVGVDINSLEDYFEYCSDNCPNLYTKGVAKILTFINGVLCGIIAFLNAKEDDIMKEDELSDSDLEDFPLIYVRSSIISNKQRPRSVISTSSVDYQTYKN